MAERLGDNDPAEVMYKVLEKLGANNAPVAIGTAYEEMVALYWDVDANDFRKAFVKLLVYRIVGITQNRQISLTGDISQMGDPAYFVPAD